MTFRLLDLPIEVQRLIFKHTVEPWDLTIQWPCTEPTPLTVDLETEPDTNSNPQDSIAPPDLSETLIRASPALPLLRVSNHFHTEISRLIDPSCTGTLHIPGNHGYNTASQSRLFHRVAARYGHLITTISDTYTCNRPKNRDDFHPHFTWTDIPITPQRIVFLQCRFPTGDEVLADFVSRDCGIAARPIQHFLHGAMDGRWWGFFLQALEPAHTMSFYSGLQEDVTLHWELAVDVRVVWPIDFFGTAYPGDILIINLTAPYALITGRFADAVSCDEDNTTTREDLAEEPYNMRISCCFAYSPWFRDAWVNAPDKGYFIDTAVEPQNWCYFDDESRLNPRSQAPNEFGDVTYEKARLIEDWHEAPWMKDGKMIGEFLFEGPGGDRFQWGKLPSRYFMSSDDEDEEDASDTEQYGRGDDEPAERDVPVT